jgi:hypothetical protein
MAAVSACFASLTFAQEVQTTYIELARTTQVIDGQQIIAIRVRPQVHLLPPKPPAPTPIPSPAEQAEAARRSTKESEMLDITATVYPGPAPVTEIRWTACGREWLAFSNVDFRHFTTVSTIESATTVYGFWQMLSFSGPEAEYLVYATQAEWSSAPAAFAGLDALHSYYEEHRAALVAAYTKQQAEIARIEALPPPPPKPVIIRYYAPAPVSATPAASQP